MPTIDTESVGAPFNFIHNQIDLKKTSLHILDYNCSDSAVRIALPPMEPFYLLQFTLAGEAELSQDGHTHRVTPGNCKIIHGDSPLNGRLMPGYRSMILMLSREGLDSALAEQIGRRPDKQVMFETPCFGDTIQGAAVASLSMTICANIETDPAFLREPVTRQMEDMLFSLILWSLPNNYTAELEGTETSAPYYVRRVERFVRENLLAELTLADLADASGVSARTLHDGFRRFRHTTPMLYLKNLRLELAHQKLLNATDESVTDIAMECHFTHLSKFAKEYRERYGALPSETLRKGKELYLRN